MAASASDDTLWTLKDGPTLPTPAVLLALNLEKRGMKMERRDEMLWIYRPGERSNESVKGELSEQECAEIRQWKQHLLLLVDHCERHHK